ncbi:MAG: hypothetical protein IIX47_05650 [Spirochaetaceae bacterium]|nr:hypothetical protein [Spirochaetaceae bacterium]
MKNRFFFFVSILFFITNFSVFSQIEKVTLEDKIEELSNNIKTVQSATEKIKLYEQLAVCQEFAGLYSEASESYISCSRLVSEQETKDSYVLKASRCFLSCGDAEKTDELLTSIASTARTGKNAPLLKLYAAWSWISKCNTFEETHEPIVILKSYLKMDSMKSVKKEILFTLWYITLENEYASLLQTEFPNSLENAMAEGKADLSPLPFWYFSARKEVPLKNSSEAKIEVENQEKEVEETKSEVTKTQPESSSKKDDKNLSENQEVFTYQLGFYSSKTNAQNLVNRCKEKNISAQIQQVTRPSGNVYFAVIVKSTDSEIGTIIKNSGFECYPIFE